jgi:hypothetical protein
MRYNEGKVFLVSNFGLIYNVYIAASKVQTLTRVDIVPFQVVVKENILIRKVLVMLL